MSAQVEALPAAHLRALGLLAAADADGITEALLVSAHGFPVAMLAELVRAGLASATATRKGAGGEVAVVRITDAGRQALAAEREAHKAYVAQLAADPALRVHRKRRGQGFVIGGGRNK